MAEITNSNKKRKIDRVDFLSDQFRALKEAIHTDVIVKPGDDGPGIRAHKAILAVKSKVFRNMLDCQLSTGESITIPELNYEELNSLLEFFYMGTLNPTNKHIRALYLAAEKYDIEYLQDSCREIITSNLSLDNFFDIYELSTIYSDTILKESLIAFAIKNGDMFSSDIFQSFAKKNIELCLEITLACLKKYQSYMAYYQKRGWPLPPNM